MRLEEYGVTGGFPEVLLSGASGDYLRELHDKIVSRDVGARYRLKQPRTLKELSLYFFSNPSAAMTYNRMQRAFAMRSVHTAEQYVGYLEEAYLIFLARPFSFKFAESVRQPRKVYTVDNGMTRALSTKVSWDRGALLENLAFQELRRRREDVFTWTCPDHSVDFLLRRGQRVGRLIQVCSSLDAEETVAREYRALFRAGRALKCRELLILTPDGAAPAARFLPEGPAVKVEALWRWLAENGR